MSDKNSLTQVEATRNQSTAEIKHENIFLFNNTFQKGVFTSTSEVTLKPGSFITRDDSDATKVKAAVAATIADTIGIVSTDGNILIPANGSADISYCTGGDLDAGTLEFPTTVTLDTLPTGSKKSFRDILTALGFHLREVTEHTKSSN